MKAKLKVMASTALIAVVALGGCASNSGSGSQTGSGTQSGTTEAPKKNVTIKYYNWDSDAEAAATAKVIEAFQKKHPHIKVESVNLVPGNSVESLKKLDVVLASGEQVDVLKFANIEETLARAAIGVLAPLDDYYTKNKINPADEYYVNPKYKGKHYGMMHTTTNWFVMFNEDALKEANLPLPKFDWTWDDFRDYAKKLTKGEGNTKRYGTYFHTFAEYPNMIAFTDKANPYVNKDLKPHFDDASFATFFKLRRAMEKDDKSVKTFAETIGAKLNINNEYTSGQAAMVVTGSFTIPPVSNQEQFKHKFKTMFAPLPKSTKSAPEGLTNIGGTYVTIANSSKHKDESYEFMRYMTTESEARVGLSGWKKVDSTALLERLYGNVKNAIDLPSLRETLYDKRVKTAVDTEISVPYANQLRKVINDGFSKYILDNISEEEAQKFMMAEADKVIKQFKP